MPVNVLAIDQGTSATKALVVATDGTILGTARVPVKPVAVAGGGVEQDPEALWRSVVDAGREALARAREPVAAVGLANQGETVLAWDPATGRPLTAALSWQDRRAQPICDRLAGCAEEIVATTGLPLDPYFAAPKMRWLREHVVSSGVATTTDAWLINRLCGAFVSDAATASRTLLLDLDRVTWSARACDLFGIDPASLPAIVGSAEAVGETAVFGASIPVAGLAVDQQAALLAEACLETGEAKCTYGTGAFLLATVGPTARRSRSGLAACIAWRLGDETTYCLDGQVYAAGAALQWLAEIGLVRDAAEIDALIASQPGGAATARHAPRTDAGGALFVAGLAGLGAPFWSASARGALLGLSLGTSRAELAGAVIEGIAAQVAWRARAMADDLGKPLTRLRADGGLSQSRAMMQVQADLLQAPVDVYPSPDATALGIAAFTRLALGAASSARQAIGELRPAATYAPRLSADQAEARLARWRRAVEATMTLDD